MNKLVSFVSVISLLILTFGCGAGEQAEPAPSGDSRLMPIPGGTQAPDPGQLPVIPPGAGTGAAGMTWDLPAEWTAEQPSSPVRRAQYRIPGSGGNGECVVFYFGPGQGGDPLANAQRWASQFSQPDGSSALPTMKTEQRTLAGYPVLWVEVSGTYSNVMISGDSFPGHRLLGAIVQGPDANWFFKFTGPEATVEENRAAFEGMLGTLRTGA